MDLLIGIFWECFDKLTYLDRLFNHSSVYSGFWGIMFYFFRTFKLQRRLTPSPQSQAQRRATVANPVAFTFQLIFCAFILRLRSFLKVFLFSAFLFFWVAHSIY